MEKVIGLSKRLWDLLYDWPMGTIISVLIFFSIALVVIYSLVKVFKAIDFWFGSKVNGSGIIEKKEYFAPYILSGYDFILMLPQTFYHDAKWTLYVSVHGQTDSIEVKKKYFNSKKEGQIIKVTYVIGIISRSLYLKRVGD